MFGMNVRTNFAEVTKALQEMPKQARFATAVAMTRTIKVAQTVVRDYMRSVLDRPTSYTLRSVRIKTASKADLNVALFINGADTLGATAGTPAFVLGHLFAGGGRNAKRLEQWLCNAGLISASERVVPGAAAKINGFGNMATGQVQQIMSQLRLGADQWSWKSKSKRSQANVKKAGRMFWSYGNHLPRGVWVDLGEGVGVRPLLIVIHSTRYKKAMSVRDIVLGVFNQRFSSEFGRAWEQAKASAR